MWCDLDAVAGNVRAWRAFTGMPVRAVVKADGYRWGANQLVRALEDLCPAFCVADEDELFALRPVTRKPIVVFGDVAPDRMACVLDAGALPNAGSREHLAAATQWARSSGRVLRVRLGVRAAAGWSGLSLPALRDLATDAASSEAEVEVWTHVTDPSLADEQIASLNEGVALLRSAGVRVTGSDALSTFSAGAGLRAGDCSRLGVGLFGATGGAAVPGVVNALRVEAFVVASEHVAAGTRVGYGNVRAVEDVVVASLRCGYSDGYPASAAGSGDVLSIGMQYAHVCNDAEPGEIVVLLDERSNLDELAQRAGRLVHEIVTTLGSARARENEE